MRALFINEGTYKPGMLISINNKPPLRILKVDDTAAYVDAKQSIDRVLSLKWLDNQDVKILEKPASRKKYSYAEREKIGDKIDELTDQLRDLEQEEDNIRSEMEEDLADYEETDEKHQKNPRFSLKSKTIKNAEMPHDIWGDRLNDIEEKIEVVRKKLRKLYDHPASPYVNPYKYEKLSYDEFTS